VQITPSWNDLMAGTVKPPAAGLWLPDDTDARRAGFYFCSSLLQLMESAYALRCRSGGPQWRSRRRPDARQLLAQHARL
jgi:hypothetical protein